MKCRRVSAISQPQEQRNSWYTIPTPIREPSFILLKLTYTYYIIFSSKVKYSKKRDKQKNQKKIGTFVNNAGRDFY